MRLVRDRYELREPMASSPGAPGAPGALVFRAFDHHHGRDVALKIHAPATPADREAALARTKDLLTVSPHPGLQQVRDDFFDGDHYCVVADWIEGMDLAHMLALEGNPGLPFAKVLGLLEQAAVVIDELHAGDPPRAHGDVQPANLILTDTGRVVLVGMGGGPPDAESDVYSLAATAHTLLTGAPPAGGAADWEGVPPAGRAVIERTLGDALSPDPARRPQTARRLVERLGAWLEDLPQGVVTFLLTDIEGSTRLWEEHPDEMASTMLRHELIVAHAVEEKGGRLIKSRGEGDSAFAVFSLAHDAAAAALRIQRELATEPWPRGVVPRLRISINTGDAIVFAGDYHGLAVNRCARLRAIAHGGQTLLSEVTANLVADRLPEGAVLHSLGTHRLKDLVRPERVFQLADEQGTDQFPPLRSLETARHNLPIQLTNFVGRDHDLQEIRSSLAITRLLTLAGMGGSGKTRLAMQVAVELVDDYPDGVWLVELAPLSDPRLVPQALASALGLRDQPGRSFGRILTDHLSDRTALILLDNCEHLIGACASLVKDLLMACPDLRILATSREQLDVPGEVVYRVRPLALPGETLPADALATFESVRLFLDRATLVRSDFSLTDSNAPAVAQICARLEGMPLAIELAAARLRSLTAEEIVGRLDDRFRLLSIGGRTAEPRQQTLRAAVDWSYDMLSPGERAVLTRASVFAGGFSLAAAEGVCASGETPAQAIVDLLATLVDRSLLSAEERVGASRYSMLETVRAYALEKLAESEDVEEMRDRHLAWFAGFASSLEPGLYGPEQHAVLDRLGADHDNVRAGLEWGSARRSVDALRLASAMARFWLVRGFFTEGRDRLVAALSAGNAGSVAAALRAVALCGLGDLLRQQGAYAEASDRYEEALEIARTAGDEHAIGTALERRALLAIRRGEIDAAVSFGEESLRIARRLGDKYLTAIALFRLGVAAATHGDLATARARYEESLGIAREIGDLRGIASVLNSYGLLREDEQDYEAARRLYEESLEITRRLEDRYATGAVLINLGEISDAVGERDTARRLFEESLTIKRDLGDRLGIAICLDGLAALRRKAGDLREAGVLYQEALAIRRSLGDKGGVAETLEGLARVAADEGRLDDAGALYACADGIHRSTGALPAPARLAAIRAEIDEIHAKLGDERFDQAWARGAAADPAALAPGSNR